MTDKPAGPLPHNKPILIVQHRRESDPGAVGQWMRANGIPADIRRPRFGDPLPQTLAGHSGAMIFGGPMSANDADEYIGQEIDWIGVALAEQKPFLGICLGAQMLAKHLGGEVYMEPQGCVEVGYEPLTPAAEGEALCRWPGHVYHWHCEGFTIPAGATALAHGRTFENQAMRYGASAFGVQFHPEITLAMMRCWTVRAAHRLSQPGARPPAEHMRGHDMHGAAVRAWLNDFLTRWHAGTLAAAGAAQRAA